MLYKYVQKKIMTRCRLCDWINYSDLYLSNDELIYYHDRDPHAKGIGCLGEFIITEILQVAQKEE